MESRYLHSLKMSRIQSFWKSLIIQVSWILQTGSIVIHCIKNHFCSTDLNCKISLPTSNHVWLIDQPKSSASIFYFGGSHSLTSAFIENIFLHMVSESQPEKRLHTLLTKGMLVEAEVINDWYGFFGIAYSKTVFISGIGQEVQFESTTSLRSESQANLTGNGLDQPGNFELHALELFETVIYSLSSFSLFQFQNDVETLQNGLDNLIGVAKQITNTEFLLQLRNLEMPDRKVMKKLLEFLTEQIQFDVSWIRNICQTSRKILNNLKIQII